MMSVLSRITVHRVYQPSARARFLHTGHLYCIAFCVKSTVHHHTRSYSRGRTLVARVFNNLYPEHTNFCLMLEHRIVQS